MKEIIERLAKGQFEYEKPSICLSEEEIRVTLEAGKMYEGSFLVSNSAGRPMKGVIYSSNRLMQLKSTSFSEAQNTIYYQFNASYLNTGESIKGQICIISDCGEKIIPFLITIEADGFTTILGKIKDLDQFTNLARMDWTEAKKIFRSEDFEKVFLKQEDRYRAIYRNLLKSISTSQALEEFLITIQKKSGIHLHIDRTRLDYVVSGEVLLDKLTLTKDHWGYAEIRVSTEAPFIQLEQKFLWADRFIGNTHQITFGIDPKMLTAGKNFGQILIKTAHQNITVEVICQRNKDENKEALIHRLQDRTEICLIKNYLGLRLNQIDLKQYLGDTEALLSRLSIPEGSKVSELFQLHMAIISGKSVKAEQLLLKFAQDADQLRKSSVQEYCAYLYLNALYKKQDEVIKSAAEAIRSYYNNGYYDWQILWFLLYTDKRYEKNKQLKLADIKEQYEYGCHSPILYYEAVCIYNEEPYLLRELNSFEIQVLNFGIKNSLVSKDLAGQYTYLANRKKVFHQIIFYGLTKLYEAYHDTDTLSTICCMLIKGMKKDEKCFQWYRFGVEAQLRITELYEYYMYSISDQSEEEIAQPVLLYFIYNSNLNDRKKAFLYANIVKHKDKNESVYRSYYKRMEVFTSKMLEAHYMNNNLAVLYQEFCQTSQLNQELSKHLPYVLYKHEISCSNPNLVGVTVYHEELGFEENIVLTEGRAQIDLYSENTLIFLVDSFGNRFVTSMEFSIKPYLAAEYYEEQCCKISDHPMLLLHLFQRYLGDPTLQEPAVALLQKVLLMEGLSEKYITYGHQALIEYYYEKKDNKALEHYLKSINPKLLPQEIIVKYLGYMVNLSLYEKSLITLEDFEYEKIDTPLLVKLCSAWLNKEGVETKNELIISICYHVFNQGLYDDTILCYLVRYSHGSILELLHLWKVSKGFGMNTIRLEERLLVLMLISGDYIDRSIEVFEEYYKNVSNHLLVRAFLTYQAYRYLVLEQEIPSDLFKVMRRELYYEENEICLLAWLKYNVAISNLSETEITFIEITIQKFVQKDIILPFFLEYKDRIKLPERIKDKCFILYKADPAKQVFIHYRILGRESLDYASERMANVFLGIHVKDFVLFYNEILEYYITEEADGVISHTDTATLYNNCQISKSEESKINQINRILQAKEAKDEKSLHQLMEHYIMTEAMAGTCFQQIER